MRRPELDRIEQEIDQERRELLRDLLESRAWTEVVRPALARKLRVIERSLAVNQERSLEDTRFVQGRYRAISEFLALSEDEGKGLFEE